MKDSSSISYLLIHPLHRIEATCRDFECTIDYDDATHTIDSTSFSSDVTCYDSGNSNRDSHAMEVLDALTYSTVSFHSTQIAPAGPSLVVHGDLNFHGQSHAVTLSASVVDSAGTVRIKGDAAVSLTEFGIDRPSLLMIPVEDTLRITFAMLFPAASR